MLKDPRNLIAVDIDNDGDSDLIVTQTGAPPLVLQNNGGNRNRSLRVTLKGFKDNHSAIGTKVEVHGENLRQKVEVVAPGPLLFGTGQSRADFVRMLWPTGVVQDEIPAERPRVDYQELDRKGSSCPTLYSWDGTKFRFITDIIGPGVIGEWEAPGEWNASDTDEYVRLDAADAQPVDGVYRFKILSQMEEVTYLDALKLVAVDTPDSVDIYNNDRYQPVPPYPDFKLWQASGTSSGFRWSTKPVATLQKKSRQSTAYMHRFRKFRTTRICPSTLAHNRRRRGSGNRSGTTHPVGIYRLFRQYHRALGIFLGSRTDHSRT